MKPFISELVRRTVRLLGYVLVLGGGGPVACSLSDLVGQSKVPAGTADPSVAETAEGAASLYRGALQMLASVTNRYVQSSGLLSDELRPASLGTTIGNTSDESMLDSRFLFADGETTLLAGWIGKDTYGVFASLQQTRGNAREARGALLRYAPAAPRDWIGHTYAMEAFAEVMLADLYCSGIPLSTLHFGGDYTLSPAVPTADVYQHAIGLFDSAIALITDSVELRDMARVGKARALLALGEYQAAQVAVAEVPVTHRYRLMYSTSNPNIFRKGNLILPFTISDGEGMLSEVGLKYGSLKDPRTFIVDVTGPIVQRPYRYYQTRKYDTLGGTPIVLASGIEAQLIKAEAELNSGSAAWLTTLNALRTTCTSVATCTTPAPAGTGGFPNLPPRIDPVTPSARIALLFEERAFWLFLTGQRQGDLRRLIRNYHWTEQQLYPSGNYYLSNAAGRYGDFVNLPIPREEQLHNPLFTGCINREA